MTLRERLKAVTNNFAWEQDWNIQEYAVHKRDIEYRRGMADAYGDVVYRLDEVLEEFPEEPVVKDKMTLTELAHEWRKIIKFKYLAYGEIFAWGGCYPVLTTGVLPLKLEVRDVGGEGAPCYIHEWISDGVTNGFLPEDLAVSIDLSEYKDERGNIDYSKCIVEVE